MRMMGVALLYIAQVYTRGLRTPGSVPALERLQEVGMLHLMQVGKQLARYRSTLLYGQGLCWPVPIGGTYHRGLHVTVSAEVARAVLNNEPVVALESTIISHGGLPYPKNLELARLAEDVVRKNGAIPATCAVINGVPKVGLDAADLDRLACGGAGSIMKASRRDLPFACAMGRHASTTVAGTMVLAHAAGIRIFATGGIGGVHRGAEQSMDVSADLLELGRTPVSVVCAGIKSILDVGKTLEVLETQGVPVVTLQSDAFPAFFTNDSGLRSPLRANSPRELAAMAAASRALGLQTGIVVAVPNPEPYADPAALETCIQKALASAAQAGVSGPATTPFLLASVERLTGGRSLEANVALLLNNARVAALMAVELSQLCEAGATHAAVTSPIAPVSLPPSTPRPGADPVVVVGGAARDVVASMSPMVPLRMGSSNPGQVRGAFGGVARNIGERLARLGQPVHLCSAVGGDDDGRALLAHAAHAGVDVAHVKVSAGGSTACYVAVHGPGGDLVVSVADMAVLATLGEDDMRALAGSVRKSRLVVADGNLSPAAFAELARLCASYAVPLFFEPTSDHKCLLPLLAESLPLVDVIKPNSSELRALCTALLEQTSQDAMAGARPIPNRAAVKNALVGFLATSRKTPEAEMDLVDVRILAQALVHAMRLDRPTATASRDATAEGLPRAVRHKHVLVSLGPLGVLWAAEVGAMSGLLRDKHPCVLLGADGLVATMHVPCVPLNLVEGAVVNTNGCGDSFCAGVIGSMLAPDGPGLLGEAAINAGHRAARECILASSRG